MTTTVAQMTTDELSEIMGAIIEKKIIELFGDPDEGFVLTESLRSRLLRQKKTTAKGERGELLDDVVIRLGLS